MFADQFKMIHKQHIKNFILAFYKTKTAKTCKNIIYTAVDTCNDLCRSAPRLNGFFSVLREQCSQSLFVRNTQLTK